MEITVKEQQEFIFRSKLPVTDIPNESPVTSLLTMEITVNEPQQQEFIFRSKLPDIDIPNERFPLHSYLFENLSKFSARPCLINASTGKIYSYADVDLISRKLAAGLHKLGIHQGDVIMIALHNSPEFVLSFLGATRIGAISTTVNPFHLPDDIQKQAQASNSKLIITTSIYAVKVRDFASANSIKIICTDDVSFSELCETDENGLPEVKIAPEETVVLPYSSGTTGLPKAVLLTHKGLITSVAQHVDGENPNVYFHDKDVIMVVLPLFHLYSMCTVMMCGLRAGSALLLMEKFEINKFVELIEKYKVTILPSVSPILSAIVDSPVAEKCDLTSVRMVMSAATLLGKKLVGAVNDKLPNAKIGQVYGMTEASVMSICTSLAKEGSEWKFGSCGNVVRNGELKVVDPITRISLPRYQNGEICFRSHQITKGYLNNKEATEETIDKEGWLKTGDIGYIDEDDQLFLVDRIKELIKYKGYQVAPAEIENILCAHPNISDAAVVPMKDELAGEIPVAFVVLATDSTVSEEDIKQHVSKQVVFYKRIHRVLFVDSIPKASSGKILRKELKDKLIVADILS